MSQSSLEMSSRHELSDEDFKWSDKRIRRLIKLVRDNRNLWHNSAKGFTGNPSKRVKLFFNIAEELGTTAYEANRRFTSLRERYGKESKKKGRECIPWPYYEDLNFLSDVIRRRDKRKSVKIGTPLKEEIETQDSTLETTEEYLFDEEEGTPLKRQKTNHNPKAVQKGTQPILRNKPTSTENGSVDLIDPGDENETVETAFKYFRLELRKMDQAKREYCIDKMMMAFLNAKTLYPK